MIKENIKLYGSYQKLTLYFGNSKNPSDYSYLTTIKDKQIYISKDIINYFRSHIPYRFSLDGKSITFGCQTITFDDIELLYDFYVLNIKSKKRFIKKGSIKINFDKLIVTEKYYIHKETNVAYLKDEYNIVEEEMKKSSLKELNDHQMIYIIDKNTKRIFSKEFFINFLEIIHFFLLKLKSNTDEFNTFQEIN
jgi:hypothetical protein